MSKIGKTEWVFLYVITGLLDLVQFTIDFFIIGAGINEVADPFIGLSLAGYFQMRGVSIIKHPTRLFSLLGVTALEEFTAAAAPGWIIDVWYIHRTVRQEDAEFKAQEEANNVIQAKFRRPLYTTDDNGNGVRQPDNRRPDDDQSLEMAA